MYALYYGFVLVSFLEDVGVGYDCFKTQVFLKSSRRNKLDVRVDYGKKKRSFHCAAFGFELSYSAKQILFFRFETQSANLDNSHEDPVKKVSHPKNNS